MADSANNLPYDDTDRESIFFYAMDLRGSTLREKADVEKLPDASRNKGAFGNALETGYFMLEPNSRSEADFKEAGLELKATPLKRNKKALR